MGIIDTYSVQDYDQNDEFRLFSDLYGNIESALSVSDVSDCRVVYSNEKGEEIFGITNVRCFSSFQKEKDIVCACCLNLRNSKNGTNQRLNLKIGNILFQIIRPNLFQRPKEFLLAIEQDKPNHFRLPEFIKTANDLKSFCVLNIQIVDAKSLKIISHSRNFSGFYESENSPNVIISDFPENFFPDREREKLLSAARLVEQGKNVPDFDILINKSNKITSFRAEIIQKQEITTEFILLLSQIISDKNPLSKISEIEYRYYSLFDNLPVPAVVHRNGIVVEINKACLEFVGAGGAEEILGKSALDFVHTDSKTAVIQRIAKMNSEKCVVDRFEEKFVTLTGEVKTVETVAVPFEIAGETYIHAVFFDISQRKMYEQKLHEKRQKLVELNATKDKFFSIIAHDLKNPFHQIMGFTEILKENVAEYDNEQKLAILGYIFSSADSAFRLLENLLQWSRTQTGNIHYNPERLSVFDEIMNVADVVQGACVKKEISLSQNVENSLFIFADKEMFQTIMRNLLSNAVKFSNRRGKIIVSAKAEGSLASISIRDFGVGMTREQIDKLYRIDLSQSTEGTENEAGTGLGLILTHEFIVKNNGTIQCRSTPGEGTEFVLKLPRIM